MPQLFELSRREQQLLTWLRHHAQAQHLTDPLAPLFAEDARLHSLETSQMLVKAINRTLKTVTGNIHAELYDCRHTFANRVALALYDLSFPLWNKVLTRPGEKRRERDIPRILLGNPADTGSLRAIWALAQVMGHGHPGTVHRSYLHFLGDWIASRIPLPKLTARTKVRHLIDLEQAGTKGGQAHFKGLDEWPLLIGLKDKLLLWKKTHFDLVRAFLDFLGLPEDQYSVIQSPRVNDAMRGWAAKTGFHLIEPDQVPGRNSAVHTDIAYIDRERVLRTERYCSLFLHPNRDDILGVRANLILLFIAFAAATCIDPGNDE